MKKISKTDENGIVRLIQAWPHLDRFTWEFLRARVAQKYECPIKETWSRQSLSANVSIRAAITVLRQGKDQKPRLQPASNPESLTTRITELEAELSELNQRYERLLLRHVQLARNASFLEGGTQLLDPLPDNTPAPGR